MLQLRFHFGERDRAADGDRSLEAAVMGACESRGVSAAALLRGVEGFGAKHQMRTERLLSLSEDAPLVAVAVGEAAVIEGLAEEVRAMASEGLVALEGVTTPPQDGEKCALGDLVKVTIWGPRSGSSSPHIDAVAALYRHGAEAATVLLGVDGVLDGERRRARFVGANHGVPAITVAVGERAAIEAALAELDPAAHLVIVEAGALSSRYPRRKRPGEGVERNSDIDRLSLHAESGVEPKLRMEPPSLHGGAVRVTMVTSEIAAGEARPRYLELIHALRRDGAAGATALRGVWGFRGGGTPHGDRVLALRRDVPMVVEAVDAPDRGARWGELARSMAGEEDVVYSQPIPRILTLE
jgi:PII-like signaling protein